MGFSAECGLAMEEFYLQMGGLEGGLEYLELVAGSVARPISVSSARRNLLPNEEDSMSIY